MKTIRSLFVVLVLAFAFPFPVQSEQSPTTQQLIEAAVAAKEAAKLAAKKAAEEEQKANDTLRARKVQLLLEIDSINKVLGETAPVVPIPDPPLELNEVQKKVYDLAKAVPDYPTKSGVLDAMSLVYSEAEAKIRLVMTGQALTPELEKYSSPSKIVSSTGKEVVKVLGVDVDRWRPFFTELQSHLQGLANQGKLNGLADHAKVWGDIAFGLKAAK